MVPCHLLEGRSSSASIRADEAADIRLGRGLKPAIVQHPGLSGVAPLSNAQDALASRMRQIAAVQRTIDVQYYIWRSVLRVVRMKRRAPSSCSSSLMVREIGA